MKLLLIPLDGRPCNTDLPAGLVSLTGNTLFIPPAEALGRYMIPADTGAVLSFLEQYAPEADAVVVSADMCVNGGIEVSRDARLSLEDAHARLDRLEKVVRAHGRKITLFSMITRGTITATRESELKLWEYTGELNCLRGRPLDEKERRRHDELISLIPPQVLKDYDFARARNQEINKRIAAWAAGGLLRRVLFLQDDAGEHGAHIAEQKELARIASGKADFMPGADEACSMLIAGAVVSASGISPSIRIIPADAKAMSVFALYEKNPFVDSIHSHMPPLLLEEKENADVDFFVNPPHSPSEDLFLYRHPGPKREYTEFVRLVEQSVASGRQAVLADCAHCNGADIYLMNALKKETAGALAGFAAWNTASNTLGTALAHAAMIAVGRKLGNFDAPSSRALARLRLLDDWLFQSVARWEFSEKCLKGQIDRFDFGSSGSVMDAELDRRMHELSSASLPSDTPPYRACFPWSRLFEDKITWIK